MSELTTVDSYFFIVILPGNVRNMKPVQNAQVLHRFHS